MVFRQKPGITLCSFDVFDNAGCSLGFLVSSYLRQFFTNKHKLNELSEISSQVHRNDLRFRSVAASKQQTNKLCLVGGAVFLTWLCWWWSKPLKRQGLGGKTSLRLQPGSDIGATKCNWPWTSTQSPADSLTIVFSGSLGPSVAIYFVRADYITERKKKEKKVRKLLILFLQRRKKRQLRNGGCT